MTKREGDTYGDSSVAAFMLIVINLESLAVYGGPTQTWTGDLPIMSRML